VNDHSFAILSVNDTFNVSANLNDSGFTTETLALEIMQNLQSEVGIKNAEMLKLTTNKFISEGCESWDDVLQLEVLAQNASVNGSKESSSDILFSYLRDYIKLPSIIASKLVAFIRQK
jgi:hypothetical protein